MNDTARTLDRLSTWAARIGLALLVVALAGLAALWAWDRLRPTESPRFSAARFAPLVAGRAGSDDAGRWVVPVNAGCPHCRETFPRIVEAWLRAGPRPALEVLYVDDPHRPADDTVVAYARMGATAQWWDSTGVWRGRWGHRRYGETLRFAPDGTLLGVDAPPEGGMRPGS